MASKIKSQLARLKSEKIREEIYDYLDTIDYCPRQLEDILSYYGTKEISNISNHKMEMLKSDINMLLKPRKNLGISEDDLITYYEIHGEWK